MSLRERARRRFARLVSYVYHIHTWDHCRQYGQYRYRVCLSCGDKKAC